MMPVPKFSNPYNLNSSTQKCTRREIFSDSDGKTVSDEDAATRKDLEWLEESLRSSFVYRTQEEQSESSLRRKEEAERVRKRRKKESPGRLGFDQAAESEFEFCLLSGGMPPGKISIQPKPPQALRRIQREYEDPPERSEERARRAKEVAVDFNWVLAQSQITFPASRRDGKNTARPELSPLSFSSLPNILVTERLNKTSSMGTTLPRMRRHKGATSNCFGEAETRPSPHELKGRLCCPLVPIRGETPSVEWKVGATGRKRRRRRKRGVPLPKQK